ncbi:transmembrane protein 154 isoform X2 [Pagrus major]|uniref:transmembrane protein 154 isoform X2 n=1 Tax=Pagrus major TaxID=143350 RepID=UPI003CC867F0
MSASWPGSMRGPRVKTPLLLLLLLLLNALTGTVLCQDEDGEGDPESEDAVQGEGGPEETAAPEESGDPGETPATEPPPTDDQTSSSPAPALDEDPSEQVSTTPEFDSGSGSGSGSGDGDSSAATDEGLSPIIILIPVVLVVVIIGMIVCGIFINRRWNNKARSQELNKEDPYLDGSSTEKVPMPMFEEDVPSVLELEMEELDQWMKKDG